MFLFCLLDIQKRMGSLPNARELGARDDVLEFIVPDSTL